VKISSITSRIEQQLVQLRADIQAGKREGSVVTVKAMEAAQGGDENIWREISRELEDAGITEQMINEHREFITAWVIKAMGSNQLEEKQTVNSSNDNPGIRESNSVHSDAEPFQDTTGESDRDRTSDGEGERDLSEEAGSEGSDEFLNAAAQKIVEFHRLGRESIESSDYADAEQHLVKARDLAVLLFGEDSNKAIESNSILAEVHMQTYPHLGGRPRVLPPGLKRGIPAADPYVAREGVLDEIHALQPNHENRLDAIERSEKVRQKELESRGGGEFQKELNNLFEEGKLKKVGGFEEVERVRKAKDERIRKEVWERLNGITQADAIVDDILAKEEGVR